MPLIDRTYFIGEVNIPNTNQVAVQQNIDNLINKYEAELLTMLFGYKMYKDFQAGLLGDPIPQIWKDLRDGAEYTADDQLYKWSGLAVAGAPAIAKRSLIANYVYYWFMRKEATQSSGVGEVATKTENSNRVSPIEKQVRAWNEMVGWIQDMYAFLEAKKADYPDLKPQRSCWDIINPFNL